MTTQTLYLIDEYLTQGGYTHGIDAETLEREAHLVAAAPDLLAALEQAYQKLGLWMDHEKWDREDEAAMVQIWGAIAKAKGN
jgi:hypothetical protein